MPSRFKDHFSAHAADYAQYRPRYPAELFDYLASICARRGLAWDCGTGNGQAALGLARHFDRIVATDASAEQIAHAEPHTRVDYYVASASRSPLDDTSADLVTVAQAIHWFDFEAFYTEVRRVLRPGGVLAVWTYGLQRVAPAVDPIINRFYDDIVGPFWPPERRYIDAQYRTIPFPFPDEPTPAFSIQMTWTLMDFTNYLRTWSATRRFVQARDADPTAFIEDDLMKAWGNPAQGRDVTWPVYLRVGRQPPSETTLPA